LQQRRIEETEGENGGRGEWEKKFKSWQLAVGSWQQKNSTWNMEPGTWNLKL